MPMLVGDVRCAGPLGGSSWKLSGGRSLSTDPTNVSKNRQVRRATVLRKSKSSADRRGRLGFTVWLSQNAIAGDVNQRAITGAATPSASGRRRRRAAREMAAVNGSTHMEK